MGEGKADPNAHYGPYCKCGWIKTVSKRLLKFRNSWAYNNSWTLGITGCSGITELCQTEVERVLLPYFQDKLFEEGFEEVLFQILLKLGL